MNKCNLQNYHVDKITTWFQYPVIFHLRNSDSQLCSTHNERKNTTAHQCHVLALLHVVTGLRHVVVLCHVVDLVLKLDLDIDDNDKDDDDKASFSSMIEQLIPL